MKRLALTLAACGGGANFYVARGFVGSVGTCDATAASGAVSLGDGGWVHGDRVGNGAITCKDGGTTTIGVRELARVAIDGPASTSEGTQVYYRLEAYDAHGTELTVTQDDQIGWSISGGEITPAYCSDMPVFGCPGPDSAMVRAQAGTATITVTYLGRSASLAVTVR